MDSIGSLLSKNWHFIFILHEPVEKLPKSSEKRFQRIVHVEEKLHSLTGSPDNDEGRHNYLKVLFLKARIMQCVLSNWMNRALVNSNFQLDVETCTLNLSCNFGISN